MQKNELRKWQGTFIRILSEKGDQALIIDCIYRKMPVWMNISELDASTECSEEELFSAADIQLPDFETLPSTAKRISHERYALIAGILPFVANDALRTAAIKHISIEKSISRQTLRRYLCLYLALQNIAALAPVERTTTRPLTQDEKNMRWALNKYYYTKRKISLSAAYSLMLKEKYCDGQGTLLPLFPSIHQFRYFHKKYNKLQTQYISRDGIKDYQRNHRPLLGEGVREFAPAVGVGMLDSTICDIFLVNDAGELIGRPLFTACVDAYSGLCCGYALSWEGGVYSLRQLMNNILTDKVAWYKKFGITIDQSDWPCNQLPGTLVTDMGREYTSTTFEQIAELGITVVKGIIESLLDSLSLWAAVQDSKNSCGKPDPYKAAGIAFGMKGDLSTAEMLELGDYLAAEGAFKSSSGSGNTDYWAMLLDNLGNDESNDLLHGLGLLSERKIRLFYARRIPRRVGCYVLIV